MPVRSTRSTSHSRRPGAATVVGDDLEDAVAGSADGLAEARGARRARRGCRAPRPCFERRAGSSGLVLTPQAPARSASSASFDISRDLLRRWCRCRGPGRPSRRREAPCGTWAATSIVRLVAVERVEVLGEGSPTASRCPRGRGAGDVLDALHRARSGSPRRRGGPGRSRRRSCPSTDGGDAVPARRRDISGSQVTWPS